MGYVDQEIMIASFYDVWIEGSPLPLEIVDKIKSISITDTLKGRDKATIEFYNPGFIVSDLRTKKGNWAWAENRKVTIQIGYQQLYQSFDFVIDSLNPTYPEDHSPYFTVNLLDVITKNDTVPCKKAIYSGKISDIIKQLAEENGYGFVVDELELKYEQAYYAKHETYFSFLRRIATKYGYRFKLIGKTLYFRKLSSEILDNSDLDRYTLYYQCNEKSIKSFDLSVKRKTRGKYRPDTPKGIGGIDKLNNQSFYEKVDPSKGQGEKEDAKNYTDIKDDPKYSQESDELLGHLAGSESTPEGYILKWDCETIDSSVLEAKLVVKNIETVQSESATPEEATAKLMSANRATEDSHDATCHCLFVDPLLSPGVRINCQGLDHISRGKYIISSRTISVDSEKQVSLSFGINKAGLDKNKKEETPKEPSTGNENDDRDEKNAKVVIKFDDAVTDKEIEGRLEIIYDEKSDIESEITPNKQKPEVRQ